MSANIDGEDEVIVSEEGAPGGDEAETTSGTASSGRSKALLGIGGAVGSAALVAALLYAGRSRRKNVDKLAAAESTPPTD